MRLKDFFRMSPKAPRPEAEALRRVKDWTRDALGVGSDVAVTASEIACTDPSCFGTETVILVLEPGRKTHAYKVRKAAPDVTEQDVRRALQT